MPSCKLAQQFQLQSISPGLLEAKNRTLNPNIEGIQMQKTAEMIAWLKQEPKDLIALRKPGMLWKTQLQLYIWQTPPTQK